MKTTIIPKPFIKLTYCDGKPIVINTNRIHHVVDIHGTTNIIMIEYAHCFEVKETVEQVYELCQPKIICEDPNFTKK